MSNLSHMQKYLLQKIFYRFVAYFISSFNKTRKLLQIQRKTMHILQFWQKLLYFLQKFHFPELIPSRFYLQVFYSKSRLIFQLGTLRIKPKISYLFELNHLINEEFFLNRKNFTKPFLFISRIVVFPTLLNTSLTFGLRVLQKIETSIKDPDIIIIKELNQSQSTGKNAERRASERENKEPIHTIIKVIPRFVHIIVNVLQKSIRQGLEDSLNDVDQYHELKQIIVKEKKLKIRVNIGVYLKININRDFRLLVWLFVGRCL